MTFEEKLDRAKVGSKAAYESLCLGSVDCLYTAALIALKSEQTARSIVMAAVADGYTGISRIKDEKHLRSWLVHELTKNTVDKLKELKSGGVTTVAAGTFAETERLPDVERLVFSIAAAFGYGTREISVLTGMSESAVSEKLFSAKARLGSLYEELMEAAKTFKAPESLKERYRTFDESVARLERTAVLSEIPVVQAPEIAQPTVVEAPEPVSAPVEQAPDIAPAPVAEPQTIAEEPDLPEPEPVAAEPEKPAKEPEKSSPEAGDTIELPYTPPTVRDDEEIFAADTDDDDEDEEDYGEEDETPVGFAPDSPDTAEEEKGSTDKAFDAETFISVVSAEKMKGSEFLRLIGNTRISNSVYREIEQNPHLTKKRLVELLEQSPLTEADYYKMLTAIKHRREMIQAKEESRLARERAGLYDGARRGKYKRKPKEAPKTELQMAIGLNVAKSVQPKQQPLTFDNEHAYSDNTDYEVTNAAGDYTPRRPREPEPKRPVGYRPDLGAVVSAAAEQLDEDSSEGAFAPKAMQDMFEDRSIEAVDPFAAIAANETGRQIKPDRIDEQRDMWEETAKQERRRLDEQPIIAEEPEAPAMAEPEPFTEDESSGTQEFETIAPTAGLSDTKPFEAHFEMLEQQAEQLGNEEHGEGESITADPIGNMSVTQIIEGEMPDEEAELNEQILGFSPNVEMTFDGDTGEVPDLHIDKDIDGLYLDNSDDDEPDDLPENQPVRRQVTDGYGDPIGEPEPENDEPRYKGEEFFYDDNTYHEGDNRGKIIFCIICAVLLAAGAAGLYFLWPKNGSADNEAETTATAQTEASASDTAPAPTEEPAAEEYSEEASFSAALSLDAFKSGERPDGTSERYSALLWEPEYMGVSGEPYGEMFTSSLLVNDDMSYVFVREDLSLGTLYAIPLNDEEHKPVGQAQFGAEYLHGFIAVGDKIYAVADHGTGPGFLITEMTRELEITAIYDVLATFTGAGMVDGKLIFAGNYTERQGEAFGVAAPYYKKGDERHDIAADDVCVIEGAAFGAASILFAPETGDLTAVVGGYATYAQFSDNGITLLSPDDDCTYVAEIGTDLKPKSVKRMKGEAFSPECYRNNGLIGLQYLDGQHGVTSYKGGKMLTTQELTDTAPEEIARAIAWSGDTAYVKTLKYDKKGFGGKTTDMLYGFDMSGSEPKAANIEADDIYDRELIKAGKYLAGISAEPGEDGERAGLRLSLYEYDGALKETAYTVIGLGEDIPRENLKYIKSDAETDPTKLAVSEDGTLFAVPTEYFDGFSAVRRVVTLKFDGEQFTQVGEMQLYDVKQTDLFILDDKLYIFTDKELIAAAADCTEESRAQYIE